MLAVTVQLCLNWLGLINIHHTSLYLNVFTRFCFFFCPVFSVDLSCTFPAKSGIMPSVCVSRSSWPTGSTWISACRTLQELPTVESETSPKLISLHMFISTIIFLYLLNVTVNHWSQFLSIAHLHASISTRQNLPSDPGF